MADRAFVVALSGAPDAGKTTLLHHLLRVCKLARPVYHDRHQAITTMTTAQVQEWFGRGHDPNEFPLAELRAELERQTAIQPDDRRRPIVLFETPFARLHHATGAFIDFLVWIDTPLDVTLSRAMLAFGEGAQRSNAPNAASDFLRWQRRYLQNYSILRPMYVAQKEAIAPTADLVLDGTRPVEESAALVRKALAARGIES